MAEIKDTYRTITQDSLGEYKEKGSKFLAYTRTVRNEEDCKIFIEEVRNNHLKARHWCYAYRIGLDGKLFRANDDGEPSGTAGRPILGQIDSFGLTNVCAVVVRYYGGVKLGTSGLKNAYKVSTQAAFEAAEIETRIVEERFRLSFPYAIMGEFMDKIKRLEVEIVDTDFGQTPAVDILVRRSEVEAIQTQLEKDPQVKMQALQTNW